MPLQPAAGVGDGTILLGKAAGRQAEHRGLDLFALDVVGLTEVLPEFRRFGVERIHGDQVLELAQAGDDLLLVGEGAHRVEALAEIPIELALVHQLERDQHVIQPVPLRQIVVGPVVLGRGRIAKPGLLHADEELGIVLPVAHLVRAQRLEGTRRIVGCQILLAVARQGQVTRQVGGEQAQVRQALDVAVTAQRVHATAQLAHVTQQQLHDGGRADDLRADAVLGPAQGIHHRHHTIRGGRAGNHLAHLQELVPGRAGDLLDHLGRVAAVVLLHDLQHAARVLHGHVDLGVITLFLVAPARVVVLARLGVVTREDAVLETVTLAHDEGGVGVVADVLRLDLVVAQQVVDNTAQEGNVTAGTQRCVVIGHGGRAREARIDHDQLRLVALLRLDHPFETHGMRFCSVPAHDQHEIGVLDVLPVVGHRAAAKRRSQTGYRRAVSDTCLVIEYQCAEAAHHLVRDVASLVGRCRCSQKAGARPAVDDLSGGVGRLEVRVAVFLHELDDARHRLVPADALPFLAARLAHLGVLQAVGAVDEIEQAGALRAQRAAADRMVRVALDVDDAAAHVLGAITQGVHDQAATDRAIGAGVAGFDGAGQLEVARFGKGSRGRKAQSHQTGSHQPCATDPEELSPVHVHCFSPPSSCSGYFLTRLILALQDPLNSRVNPCKHRGC